MEVPTHGEFLTWTNCQEGQECIKECLDRKVANPPWMESYPNAMVTNLGPTASDHLPLLLELDPPERNFPRPFRFKCFWVQDGGGGSCLDIGGEG